MKGNIFSEDRNMARFPLNFAKFDICVPPSMCYKLDKLATITELLQVSLL